MFKLIIINFKLSEKGFSGQDTSKPHPQSKEPAVHHVKAVAILSPVRDAPLLLADLGLAASVLHEHLAAHSLRKRRQSGLLRLWQAHRWIDARQHARDDLRRPEHHAAPEVAKPQGHPLSHVGWAPVRFGWAVVDRSPGRGDGVTVDEEVAIWLLRRRETM